MVVGYLDYDCISVRKLWGDLRRLRNRFPIKILYVSMTLHGWHVAFSAPDEDTAISVLLESKCDERYKYFVLSTHDWRIDTTREIKKVKLECLNIDALSAEESTDFQAKSSSDIST